MLANVGTENDIVFVCVNSFCNREQIKPDWLYKVKGPSNKVLIRVFKYKYQII